jgi:hypothetical protein
MIIIWKDYYSSFISVSITASKATGFCFKEILNGTKPGSSDKIFDSLFPVSSKQVKIFFIHLRHYFTLRIKMHGGGIGGIIRRPLW